MRNRSQAPRGTLLIPVILLALLALTPGLVTAAEDAAEDARPNPMLDFERLVGGRWHIGPLQHAFEWGVGQRTVIARTYLPDGTLSSEARWFWHPGAKAIKGYSIDAAGDFFADMTTSFEGDVLTNELVSIGADGTELHYTGVWHFTDRDHYDWTLYQQTAKGREKSMAMTAVRKPSAAE